MAEIPDHLLRRSAERRAALGGAADPPAADAPVEAAPSAAAPAAPAEPAAAGAGGDKMAALLARSAAAKAARSGGAVATAPSATPAAVATAPSATPAAVATAPSATPAAVATAPAAAASGIAPAPIAKGPDGHTQRLLTVVKAGSIQDVKATPMDKVHTWPHLLIGEFVAALACTAFLLIFSAVVNAPFLAAANFNFTPNPSKAPWYFLGLQELLTMFHPMVAGVTIPGIGIFGLMLAPYTDRNPANKPEDRKFAIALMTLFLMFWAVLVIIGSFFRGPGFNFTFPWRDGVFFDL